MHLLGQTVLRENTGLQQLTIKSCPVPLRVNGILQLVLGALFFITFWCDVQSTSGFVRSVQDVSLSRVITLQWI